MKVNFGAFNTQEDKELLAKREQLKQIIDSLPLEKVEKVILMNYLNHYQIVAYKILKKMV